MEIPQLVTRSTDKRRSAPVGAREPAEPPASGRTCVSPPRNNATRMTDPTESHYITLLLSQVAAGDEAAREALVGRVYEQLRRIAQVRMAAERAGHTLQATELVHEAYLKMSPSFQDREFRNRYEFYAAAGEAMRRILVDHARRRRTAKRGSGKPLHSLTGVAELAEAADPTQTLVLNEAFERLESANPKAAELIRLRFFAGLDVAETALALGVSEATVKRRWRYARTVLFEAMEDGA